MKKIIFALIALTGLITLSSCQDPKPEPKPVEQINSLTVETFKTKVGDFTTTPWKCVSELPVIVDFYTDWCTYCPEQERNLLVIQKEYAGKVLIFRINAEEEAAVAKHYKIDSYPTLLLVPKTGEPAVFGGLQSIDRVKALIKQEFDIN